MENRILKGSVRRALDLIGDRWTLQILLSAFCNVQRFDDWKTLHRISPSILSARLKRLVDKGMLEKKQLDDGSSRPGYSLTRMGKDLFPWALAVWAWERTWVYRSSEHPVRLVHRKCGQVTSARFECAHCHQKVGFDSVLIHQGPGYDDLPVSVSNDSRRASSSVRDAAERSAFGGFLDIIGDRWSFLVVSAAYFGVTRFDEFQDQLHIASNILSDRLRRLAEHGMLARNRYQEKPPRYEYILTEKNIAFYQVALMLALWGDKWLPGNSGPVFRREHQPCGREVKVVPVCERCGEVLRMQDVDFPTIGSD